jgi:predicted dithiol-disulfide oxidoreductase (DUF899 family)
MANLDRHPVVSHAQWLEARRAFLKREKELTRLRDEIAAERRALPWERVEKDYAFDGPRGRESLGDLFAGKSQLLVYHFMYPVDWEDGCKSCSFWMDSFERTQVHLAARDTSLVLVSISPFARLEAFRKRMGWTFHWVSSEHTDFNRDFGVTFTPEEIASKAKLYNYGTMAHPVSEAPGLSVFFREPSGQIFHTYSTYTRGLDALNAAYQLLDLVPKGRDEDDLPYTMSWLRHRDRY